MKKNAEKERTNLTEFNGMEVKTTRYPDPLGGITTIQMAGNFVFCAYVGFLEMFVFEDWAVVRYENGQIEYIMEAFHLGRLEMKNLIK